MARVSALTRVRRARDDERGIGVVTVLMVALTVFALGAAWTQFGVHQAEASALERMREQARHAAEAGANMAMGALAGNPAYAGTNLTTVNLNDSTGQYEVSVTPVGFDPYARYIVARGYAPSKTSPRRVARQVEQQVRLVPIDGFQYGLFSLENGIGTSNYMTVIGDIYSTSDVILGNQAVVSGRIISQGAVTTNNQSTISGDVRAKGNVTLNDSKTTVTGNVYSNANISLTGTIKGNAQATGSITGGTVTGFRAPGSPPPQPVVQTLPTYTWNPANYPGAMTWSDPSAFYTYWSANKAAFSGAHRITCTGSCPTLTLDKSWTMTGDVTIVYDGQIVVSRDVTNGTNPRVPVTLSTISFSSTSPAISATNNLVLPSDIRVLFFAPNGSVSFQNLKNFTGAVYAKNIQVDQNFTLTWFPVTVSGFSWSLSSASHFTVESQSFKEVRYTNPS